MGLLGPYFKKYIGEKFFLVVHVDIDLAERSGLLGLSGVSGDVRDLEQAAAEGHARAQLALDVFTTDIRRHLGSLLVELGGADVLVFTGGIGENGVNIRDQVCTRLEELGIQLDLAANRAARGESRISTDDSRTQIWIVPTNEELIVARQTKQLLERGNPPNKATVGMR